MYFRVCSLNDIQHFFTAVTYVGVYFLPKEISMVIKNMCISSPWTLPVLLVEKVLFQIQNCRDTLKGFTKEKKYHDLRY